MTTSSSTITLPTFTRNLWAALRFQAYQARKLRREAASGTVDRETVERGERAAAEVGRREGGVTP